MTAEESGGFIRGTEESNRVAPLMLTTHEVRTGAILSGSGCAECQATGDQSMTNSALVSSIEPPYERTTDL